MKDLNQEVPKTTPSPFGGEAVLVQSVPIGFIVEQYKRKCGIDVSPQFGSLLSIGVYECAETGYRFWRPKEIAGNEIFYSDISHAWKHYYREERWEYFHVRKLLTGTERILEVGCGKGYFLRSIEERVKSATGLEFNDKAIRDKVTSAKILHASIEEMAATGNKFDLVCAFHVLEHVTEPRSFIEHALACLSENGTLVLSTPNYDNIVLRNQLDIFDAPPHHMGHFAAATYKNIANQVGCSVSKVIIQPRKATLPTTTHETNRSVFHRTISLLVRSLLNLSYRINNEPGETILVFLEKRSHPKKQTP